MPILIAAILGLVLSVIAINGVAPSMIEAIKAKKVETSISRADALAQQIVRFYAVNGRFPTNMAELVSAGFWSTGNDNGFGNQYSFSIDQTKGLINVMTTFPDTTTKNRFLLNYRNVFKPVDLGGTSVQTSYIVPTFGSMSVPVIGGQNSNVVAGSAAPSPATTTYWYDTSGPSATLKVYDSTKNQWVATGLNAATNINPSMIASSVSALPATANDGDIRYVTDGDGNLAFYVYYGGQWLAMGVGGAGGTGGGVGTGGTGNTLSLPDIIFSPSIINVLPSSSFTVSTNALSGLSNPLSFSVNVIGDSVSGLQCNTGSGWGACSSTVSNGQSIQISGTAPSTLGASSTILLTLGSGTQTVQGTFQVQTIAPLSVSHSSSMLVFYPSAVNKQYPSETITLTNPNAVAMSFSAVSSDQNFSVTNNCNNTVPANGTCTLTVTPLMNAVEAITKSTISINF